VDAAARSTVNPDAALAGSREAFGSAGAGQNSAREQWGDALSQRISLMTARNQSEARIQLDPPELGRLMIQIQVNNEQASVSFTSPHAMVRDALEASVPRLQDMLSEQGLDLLDVDISDQSQQQDDEQNEARDTALAGTGEEPGATEEVESSSINESGLSLVDDYV
jgi:flagellar hook-length control protein FliK